MFNVHFCTSLSAKISTEKKLSNSSTQPNIFEHWTLLGFRKYCAELSSQLTETLRNLCLLQCMEKWTWPKCKCCDQKQKQEKRGSISTRLKTTPTRPVLPSFLFTNVRSLDKKMDYIKLHQANQWEMRLGWVFFPTETWLQYNITDLAIQLERLTSFWADRDVTLTVRLVARDCVCM